MSSLPLKADAPSKAAEPSMEEILASIRKIISDDDSGAAKPAAKSPAPEPVQEETPKGQDDIDAILAGFESAGSDDTDMEAAMAGFEAPAEQGDVLELTEEMAAPDTGFEDVDFVDPEPPPPPPKPVAAPQPVTFQPPPVTAPVPPMEALLSDRANSQIAAAFGSLSHTILSQNARTLDDLVQDMLRPMLKAWLDDNLPSLVERLVRAEIERVSRGGR